LPAIAVTVRRLNDIGKQWWNMFIPVYNLLLVLRPSIQGITTHGDAPDAQDSILLAEISELEFTKPEFLSHSFKIFFKTIWFMILFCIVAPLSPFLLIGGGALSILVFNRTFSNIVSRVILAWFLWFPILTCVIIGALLPTSNFTVKEIRYQLQKLNEWYSYRGQGILHY